MIGFYLKRLSYGTRKFLRFAGYVHKETNRVLIITPDRKIQQLAENEYDLPVILVSGIFNRWNLKYFIGDILFFLIAKYYFKKLIKKIDLECIFLDTDTGYSENLVISQLVDAIVIQFTIDSTNVAALVNYYKIKTPRSSRIVMKLFGGLSRYRRFGILRGFYLASPGKHIVLKLLKLLPQCERKGGGKSRFLCVNGPIFKNIFTEYGVMEHKIIDTGSPDDDEIFPFLDEEYQKKQKQLVRQRLNIKENQRKIAVLFLQPFENYYYFGQKKYGEWLDHIIKFLLDLDVCILIKTHPKHKKGIYRRYESQGIRVFEDNELATNFELMILSDLMITISSSVGLQGMALKRPVITYNFDMIIPEHLKYIKPRLHANTFEEFKQTVINVLKDSPRLQYDIISQYMRLDGKNKNRIIELLNEHYPH